MADEKTIYSNQSISVTDSKITVGSTVYPMRNISSVSVKYTESSRVGGYLVLLFGIGLAFSQPFIGIPTIALAIYYARNIKKHYYIMLATSGGEKQAYESMDSDHINEVMAAINQAISTAR